MTRAYDSLNETWNPPPEATTAIVFTELCPYCNAGTTTIGIDNGRQAIIHTCADDGSQRVVVLYTLQHHERTTWAAFCSQRDWKLR